MMSGLFALTCIFLAFQSSAVGLSPAASTKTDERLMDVLREIKDTLRGLRSSEGSTCGEGLGAVVAQQATELSLLKDKLAADLSLPKDKQAADLSLLKDKQAADLSLLKDKLQAIELQLQTSKTELESKQADNGSVGYNNIGSTFVRWGRKVCPSNTTLVYSGIAGGKRYNQKGSGTNTLCLTRTPEFDDALNPPYTGYIYGAEYEYIDSRHNHDVLCSVCRAPQSTTIMVPATRTCPTGWTPQYTGHLISQYKNHFATEYVCLDGSPEDNSTAATNDDGSLFYYVTAQCGSLPCPPYSQGKVVTCAVCSK